MARRFLSNYGLYFVQRAYFGALLTLSTAIGKSEQNQNQNKNLSAELSGFLHPKASTKLSLGPNPCKINKNSSIFVASIGGDPFLILNGEEKEWQISAQKNLALVDASFVPVYELAKRDSEAEKILKKVTNEITKNRNIDLDKYISDIDKNNQPKDIYECEILYYYFRGYGLNYPILYSCSRSDYDKYKDIYNGNGKFKKVGGLYLNYDKHFIYTNMEIPYMTYCYDTYFYYYSKTTYGKMVKDIGDPNLTPSLLKELLG